MQDANRPIIWLLWAAGYWGKPWDSPGKDLEGQTMATKATRTGRSPIPLRAGCGEKTRLGVVRHPE